MGGPRSRDSGPRVTGAPPIAAAMVSLRGEWMVLIKFDILSPGGIILSRWDAGSDGPTGKDFHVIFPR